MEKMQTAEKIEQEKQLSQLPAKSRTRLPARRETQLSSRPPRLPETDTEILDAALKAAGLTRKDLGYSWRVSRQNVDQIFSGLKPSPLRRIVDLFDLLASRGQGHRVPEITRYLVQNFNLIVLDAEQAEAVRKLAGVK